MSTLRLSLLDDHDVETHHVDTPFGEPTFISRESYLVGKLQLLAKAAPLLWSLP